MPFGLRNLLTSQLFLVFTAIGVVVHEYAHKTAAESRGLYVSDVCYFQLGSPAGYVVHEEGSTYLDSFVIATAPLTLNSIISVFAFTAAFTLAHDQEELGFTPIASYLPNSQPLLLLGFVFLVWIGCSTAYHALPSHTDLNNIKEAAKRFWNTRMFAFSVATITVGGYQVTNAANGGLTLDGIAGGAFITAGVLAGIRPAIIILSLPLILGLKSITILGAHYTRIFYTTFATLVSYSLATRAPRLIARINHYI